MANTAGGNGHVEIRQVVEASRDVAFEAWTQPEHVRRWWTPNATTVCTLCEIDLRVGGRYRIHMHDDAEQSTCKVEGEFLEVAAPHRLVYTWNAETHQGRVTNTLVTVEFRRKSDRSTEIVLRHDRLPDTPIRRGHRETWEKMLESFARHRRGSAST